MLMYIFQNRKRRLLDLKNDRRAYGIVVERGIRIAETRVRFSLGPHVCIRGCRDAKRRSNFFAKSNLVVFVP